MRTLCMIDGTLNLTGVNLSTIAKANGPLRGVLWPVAMIYFHISTIYS